MKKNNGWLILLAVIGLFALFLFYRQQIEKFTDPKCPNGGIFFESNNLCYSPASAGTPVCPAGSAKNTDVNIGNCQSLTCEPGWTDDGSGDCKQGNSYQSKKFVDAISCSSGQLFNGICVQPCPSGSTLIQDPRLGPQCTYNPSGAPSTPASAPAPAPTPCTSSYKSIPGGSLETKCFTTS